MTKSRLEAFSDGVLAIIITIMVLELKVPHGTDLASLRPLLPVFLAYLVSFVFLAIYWNNHHHLFQVVKHVNGNVLWANMHLLFWLSTVPFVTGWVGQNHAASIPMALYGAVLLLAACAYFILTRALLPLHERESPLAQALGRDFKGKISIVIYAAAIPLAFVRPWAAGALYVAVAIIWLVPDRRMERVLRP
ncbi:MAG TPA: TMEM175 family protein [Candidatus Eisenbacteria bacterium]